MSIHSLPAQILRHVGCSPPQTIKIVIDGEELTWKLVSDRIGRAGGGDVNNVGPRIAGLVYE